MQLYQWGRHLDQIPSVFVPKLKVSNLMFRFGAWGWLTEPAPTYWAFATRLCQAKTSTLL